MARRDLPAAAAAEFKDDSSQHTLSGMPSPEMLQTILSSLGPESIQLFIPMASQFLRGMIDDPQLKERLQQQYQQLLSSLFGDDPANIPPALQAISQHLENASLESIKQIPRAALAFVDNLKDPEFRQTVLAIANEVQATPLLQNLALALLAPAFFAYQNKNTNPHQWIYFLYIANELRAYGFPLIKNLTGINLNFSVYKLIMPVLPLLIAFPELRTAFLTRAMPLITRLPRLAYQASMKAAKNMPLLAIGEYPRHVKLTGKTLSAVYFMLLTPVVTRSALATIQDISSVIGMTPPTSALQLLNTVVSLASAREVGILTRDLSGRYQQMANQVTLHDVVISGWQAYQQVRPLAVSLYDNVRHHPFRLTYNTYVLLSVLHFANASLRNYPGAIMRMGANVIIYVAPLFPERSRELAAHIPVEWLHTNVPPLFQRSADLFNQSPFALRENPDATDTQTQLIQAGLFALLNMAGRSVINNAPRLLTYAVIAGATAYFPQSAAISDAAYQFIASRAMQIAGQDYLARELIQFLINLGLYQATANLTQQYTTSFAANASEQVAAGYTQAKTAFRQATEFASEQRLRLRAYWSPHRYVALGQYYQNQQRYQDAIDTYEFVPAPTDAELAKIAALQTIGITTAAQLLIRFRDLSEILPQLPTAIQSYIGAQCAIYTCQVAITFAAHPKLQTVENQAKLEKLLNGEDIIYDEFSLAEFYKKMKFFEAAAAAYAAVLKPANSELANIDPNIVIPARVTASIKARIIEVVSKRLAFSPNDSIIVKAVVEMIRTGLPAWHEKIDEMVQALIRPELIDAEIAAHISHHIAANRAFLQERNIRTIDELVTQYKATPYYDNDANSPDLPQFSREIDRYLRAQAYKAACQVATCVEKLPNCKTPADFSKISKLLKQARRGLDKLVTYPKRINEADFYRLVEWQVAHAKLLILSNQDPIAGFNELFYLLQARHNDPKTSPPIAVLGALSADNLYYPSPVIKSNSLQHVVVPALVSLIAWIEKNCLQIIETIEAHPIRKLNGHLEHYRQLATLFLNQLQQACRDNAGELIIKTLAEGYAKITEAISSLEMTLATHELQQADQQQHQNGNLHLAQTICMPTAEKQDKQALRVFIDSNYLINATEAQQTAKTHKDQQQWALSFAYYRAALELIERQGIPAADPANPVAKTYYRVLYNCGLTLENYAGSIVDPVQRLATLNLANIYYQNAKKAGEITTSDTSPTRLREFINKTVKIDMQIQQQTQACGIDEKRHASVFTQLRLGAAS
jgi:hypothetical protein